MIKQMATRLINFLESKDALHHDSKEVYVYGADIILYTFLSTLGLVLLALFLGQPIEGVIIIMLFYYNQSVGGGYHAKTHFRCFVLMLTGMLCALLLTDFTRVFFISVGILSIAYLFYTPLVINPKRTHLKKKKKHLRNKSIGATTIETIVYVILLLVDAQTLYKAFSLGLLVSAISRFTGKKTKHQNTD